jgi:hypothetical protein
MDGNYLLQGLVESSKSINPGCYVRGYAEDRVRRTVTAMQRLFSMFPAGLPGLALILLRVSVASTVLVLWVGQRDDLPLWLTTVFIATAALLTAGFLTPIVALLAMAVQFASILFGFAPWPLVAVALILNAAALALLGPGAYSYDAVRFGRRVVDLRSNQDE